MSASMRAAALRGGGWTVSGGDEPARFRGGRTPQASEEIMEEEDCGLDYFGVDEIGVDWMDAAKGATGLLSGFGGMLSGGGGDKGGGMSAKDAAEKQKLEDEKKRAEQSAANTKLALGIGGGALLAVIFTALLLKK